MTCFSKNLHWPVLYLARRFLTEEFQRCPVPSHQDVLKESAVAQAGVYAISEDHLPRLEPFFWRQWYRQSRHREGSGEADVRVAWTDSLVLHSAPTAPCEVNVVSRPRLMETSVVQKWAVDLGCTLFIIGSALLAAISGLDLVEDMLTCGASVFVICHKESQILFTKNGGRILKILPGLKLPSPKTLNQGYEAGQWNWQTFSFLEMDIDWKWFISFFVKQKRLNFENDKPPALLRIFFRRLLPPAECRNSWAVNPLRHFHLMRQW